MSSILARLSEHKNVESLREIKIQDSYGTLPSHCECGGFLDFVRINNETKLKCRECNKILKEN